LLEINEVKNANEAAIKKNAKEEEELKLRTSENEHFRSNLSVQFRPLFDRLTGGG
jgi:hypothetical protein